MTIRRRTVSSTQGGAYSATTATVPSTRARVISPLGAPTPEAGGPGRGDGATRPVSRLSLVRPGHRTRRRGGRAPAGRRDHAPSSLLSEEALGPDDEHHRHQQELEDQRELGEPEDAEGLELADHQRGQERAGERPETADHDDH